MKKQYKKLPKGIKRNFLPWYLKKTHSNIHAYSRTRKAQRWAGFNV
jgi:hypothetical protein